MKRSRIIPVAILFFSITASGRTPAAGPFRGKAVVSDQDAVADGYPTFNGTRCREYLPGLFFTYDGEVLDFRGAVATFRNIALIRTRR